MVCVGTTVLYVGSTTNLRERLKRGHANAEWQSHQCCIKYKESVKYGEHLMTEARLIRRLKPIYNKRGHGGHHSLPAHGTYRFKATVVIAEMTQSEYADYLCDLEVLKMSGRTKNDV